MFESRSSKYLYLPSQILSHSWTTSLSRQYTIQIWRPKFTTTDRQPPQPPHHTTTSSPGSSRFPHKEAMEHSRITWPISAGLPTILDRIKWKSRPQSPPNSRMKPRKSQNAPFSHPLGRGGKRKRRRACHYVSGIWIPPPPPNREEKSLRHVAMVAKFLEDNKTKTPLKKWIRTVSKFIDLIQFH